MFFEEGEYEQAELMVMTAREDSRRKGIAHEACLLMMRFAVQYLNTKEFIVKINQDNEGSILLFQSLGFKEHRRIEAFQEVHLTLNMVSTFPNSESGKEHLEEKFVQAEQSSNGNSGIEGISKIGYYTITGSKEQEDLRVTLEFL